MAGNLRCMYRHLSREQHVQYHFCPGLFANSPSLLTGTTHLSTRRGCGTLLCKATTFQTRAVDVYQGNDRPKIELLCLPVLKFDETTRVGMANVVVQLLKDAQLLVESLPTEENAAVWILAPPDIGKCYALIAGDGLSHERWCSFEKELLELQE
jgi:hypothetical protein